MERVFHRAGRRLKKGFFQRGSAPPDLFRLNGYPLFTGVGLCEDSLAKPKTPFSPNSSTEGFLAEGRACSNSSGMA